MKTILAIIASPRKLGNSEIMAKEISRCIETPHRLNLLRLSDFHIRPCTGCYQCLFKSKRCVLKDDLDLILDAMAAADALILAVPTYFLGANAELKVLLDRGLAFYGYAEKLWGKPAVGVAIAGIEGLEGYTPLVVESFLKMLLCDIKAVRVAYGALPGEIFVDSANKSIAAELGRALFAPAPAKNEPSCPLCGGQVFRFLGADRVKCMLCSNTGTLCIMENGRLVFEIQRGGHDLFLTQAEAVRHGQWLRQMKDRFLAQKSTLKKIAAAYRRGGTWIKPAPQPADTPDPAPDEP